MPKGFLFDFCCRAYDVCLRPSGEYTERKRDFQPFSGNRPRDFLPLNGTRSGKSLDRAGNCFHVLSHEPGRKIRIHRLLVSDKASDRVGAVLFWDPDEETTNVAFYDEDGFASQCGVYAKPASDPDFEYLGDGKVTFQLETEGGVVYRHALTISVDGSDVFFVSEDDLQDRKN